MGTRADFYVGRGAKAEWLGSIAWDGHPEKRLKQLKATTEAGFRERVGALLAKDDSATRPADGWPWPWEDSRLTDYSYAWDEGAVWTCCFGHRWMDEAQALAPPDEDEPETKECVFPDMKDRQNVAWGRRSGLLVFRV